MADTRLQIVVLAALLCVGCADIEPGAGDLCTPERDPENIVCRAEVDRISSLTALGRRGRSESVLWFRNSPTDTMNPNGRDISFRIWTYDVSDAILTIHDVDPPLVSTSRISIRFESCEGVEPMEVLDSRVLMPDAVARYEEMFGLLVFDAATRTAFRQEAACFSSTGEVQIYVAIQRWNEMDGFQAWFFNYDTAGELIDVLGPCEDFSDPALCAP